MRHTGGVIQDIIDFFVELLNPASGASHNDLFQADFAAYRAAWIERELTDNVSESLLNDELARSGSYRDPSEYPSLFLIAWRDGLTPEDIKSLTREQI